jgi:predicted RNA binding protein YcfA (HicA-like mRNA interferase family)
MTDDLGQLIHFLRNTPVRDLIAALRRDGFSLERQTRTGGRIYSHPDGRLTSIHGSVAKTLGDLVEGRG